MAKQEDSGWGMGDWGIADLDLTSSLSSAIGDVDITSSFNQMVEQANKVSARARLVWKGGTGTFICAIKARSH